MNKLILICGIWLLTVPVWAQQIGSGAIPLSHSRLGFEAGGYLDRGAGTGALIRYMNERTPESALEIGAGGATGDRGARALFAYRQTLLKEDVSFPGFSIRTTLESYGDEESTRRNGISSGMMISQGFALAKSEFYGFAYPHIGIGIVNTSNEFEFVSGSSFGVNTSFKSSDRTWIGSVELDLAFQNTANALMVGLATEIE